MAQLSDLLTRAATPISTGLALLALAAITTLYLIETFLLAVPNPTGMPLLNSPPGARKFRWSTRLAFHLDSAKFFRSAWDQYLKHGRAVVIPGVGFRNEIIMPPSQMRWVLSQPSSRLSVRLALADIDQPQWSLGDHKFVVDGWQGDVIKKQMNAVLESVCAGMNEELQIAFEERFGGDTERWREVDLYETIRKVTAQAAGRFMVGAPLCRDETYNRLVMSISDNLILNAGMTGSSPKVMRPFIGQVFNTLIWRQIQKFKPTWRSLYDERVAHIERYAADDPDHPEPNDIMQMMLRCAYRERPHEFRDFENITRRLCATNFGIMHQTAIQMTNLILNIVGSDAEFNTLAALREEVQRVLYADGNDEPVWTKAKLAQLVKADSVARETMRLQSFGGRATFRYVHGDLETPEGHVLHNGNIISFLGQPVHTDAELFADPFQYDPFRYSRARDSEAAEKGGKLSFVNTSAEFLPFGHGPHACPGRFLIDYEFKMTIAYLLRNYDLEFPPEYNGKRPDNVWVTEAIFPPPGARIRVKRRKATS